MISGVQYFHARYILKNQIYYNYMRNERTNHPPKDLNIKEYFGNKSVYDIPMNLP